MMMKLCVEPDHKAFVCLNEKAGSTTWKLALLRAGPHTEFHNLTVSPYGAPAEPACGEYSVELESGYRREVWAPSEAARGRQGSSPRP